jgi:hypothetical protein
VIPACVASILSSAAALVKRLRKPEMTDDEVDEIVCAVETYLGGRLCAADWRSWLRSRAGAAS